MSTIFPLHLPRQAKVTGALRTRDNVRNLVQDMLQIELGNVVIDVGWYPDWNPNGEYRVTVFRDSYSDPIEPQLRTRDVTQVSDAIYRYVEKYSPRVLARGSRTTFSTTQVFSTGRRLIDADAIGSSVSEREVIA